MTVVIVRPFVTVDLLRSPLRPIVWTRLLLRAGSPVNGGK
jgi:hypothetical protein